MIGLDSNVVVRYLVQDDAKQSRAAARIIERDLSDATPGYVSLVAIAEIAWVLERSYRFSRAEIAAAIELMLQAQTLTIECEREVFLAMTALRDGRGSFGDALIGALGTKAGCSSTLTFGRAASRLPDFSLIVE
jgi:predicted nucleic-acid-binding protein